MTKKTRQSSLPGMDMESPAGEVPPEVEPAPSTLAASSTESTAAVDPSCAVSSIRSVTTLADQSVWVVDAHSLIFQVFHAIPEMTSPRGEPVNAVYGFTRDILYLLEQKKPDFLICAFDMSGPTFRHTLYSDYKLQRTEMPTDLRPQLPLIREMLRTLGVPVFELQAYEADDILATVAMQVDKLGGECYLVTNDKDCRQLITDRVQLYNVRKNQMFDAEMLAAEWGIRPDQVVDFQALVGDPVDNVPGVPLIGPKLARELLNTYGTLEGILQNAESIAGAKRRQNLIAAREQVLLSRELTRLNNEVPVEIDWEAARVDRLDLSRLLPTFMELGFHSFADKARNLQTNQATRQWRSDYRTVESEGELAELVAQLQQQERVAIDIQATGVLPRRAALLGIAFSWESGSGHYVPLASEASSSGIDATTALQTLRSVLESSEIKKVGQNLKFAMIVLRAHGIALAGAEFDTMIASYLLDAGERNHTLDELAKRYLDHNTIKLVDLVGTGKQQRPLSQVPIAELTRLSAEAADVTLRLQPVLEPRLQEWQLGELFRTLEMPLVEVLAELEWTGIRVDRERLAALSQQYGERLAQLEAEIYELSGHPFNIASPKQLQTVLFAELNLPVLKKTKTGPSTDADVLQQLALQHPLPAKIIEFRQYSKLKGTYVDALPELIHPDTGRVHACFNQVVAATGRLSSSDPNLQNIPIRHETGREIRSAFLPGQNDWQLLAADYSQIELRVLAHFSGDPLLREAFDEDQDIHTLVASQVHGVALDQVTREMRHSAKAVNFGVIYGQSAFGLAQQLSIEQDEAAAFIEAYFRRYEGVEKFLSQVLAECHAKNYVSTLLGRRRSIRGVRPNVGRQLNLPERTAVNTVIQGSAADLIKLAMIDVHRRMGATGLQARMLLQIHDELVFEAPPEEIAELASLVEEAMTHVLTLEVPLKVDIKTGSNWAEVEPRLP